MAENVDLHTGRDVRTAPSAPSLTIRDVMTGRAVVVRGVGALAGCDIELDGSVSLLKPIAEQALTRIGEIEVG